MKNSRKLLLLILLLCCFSSYSQRFKKPQNLPRYDFKKIHFGFTLGLNELNFNLRKNSNTLSNDSLLTLQPRSQKGFNLGIVSNLRLGKYADLRFIPMLVFAERNLEYGFTNEEDKNIKRIESTLLDFPIYIKYKAERYNNKRF